MFVDAAIEDPASPNVFHVVYVSDPSRSVKIIKPLSYVFDFTFIFESYLLIFFSWISEDYDEERGGGKFLALDFVRASSNDKKPLLIDPFVESHDLLFCPMRLLVLRKSPSTFPTKKQ